MKFRSQGSLLEEMQRMETMRQQDPVSAANTMANGKLLVEWARDGRLKELQCALDNMDEDRVILFFSVRMFRGACAARRLDVLRFMIANGFDVTQSCMRDLLHSVIDPITDEQDAVAWQPLIRFLIDAGVDVNWQRKSDFYTALHLACAKNLYGIAYLLILYDADVNAIASNDEMPLACAQRMALLGHPPTAADAERNELLISLLERHGARPTWRKAPASSSPSTASTSHSGATDNRRILSFSSIVGFASQAEPTPHRPVSALEPSEEHVHHAFAQGIQLDTEE